MKDEGGTGLYGETEKFRMEKICCTNSLKINFNFTSLKKKFRLRRTDASYHANSFHNQYNIINSSSINIGSHLYIGNTLVD